MPIEKQGRPEVRRPSRRELFAAAAAAPAMFGAAPKRRNVIFILSDDHRYDALGFLKPQDFLETPQLDSLAREGVHCKNAFVTTALCSPSRATILTGKYAHRHGIIDNGTAIPQGTAFFPQLLQKAGYSTAFVGKWHMGGSSDEPQPGFNHWVSFKGQGTYVPGAGGLNVDGQRVAQKGYITDELTDYAVKWLEGRGKSEPYFLYLSHKAVHGGFTPADRHKGRYRAATFRPPLSMTNDPAVARHRPMWVQNQRNSYHGAEFYGHSPTKLDEQYKRYAETLLGVDESVGRVLDTLRKRGELDSTLVIYMGDNGFAFGEHGLVDKRTAYEESMRVPLLMRCPELFQGGRVVSEVVANLDIMPTVLEAAGVIAPGNIDGRSFLPLARGDKTNWRDSLLYEYFWEYNFPQTPTMFALRGDRYKFIRYHGIWDLDELYDLSEDPMEMRNLIFSTEHAKFVEQMRKQLWETLRSTGGMSMPLYPDKSNRNNLRSSNGTGLASFPAELMR